MMELYVIEDYKDSFPGVNGSQLTDLLIEDCLAEAGIFACRVLRTEKGKPYVDREDIHLSVSHSGNYFVCLIADRPAGVDVQKVHRTSMQKIGRRYFTEEERAYLEKHGESGFFRLWTRKEAYSKLVGTGLEEIIKGTPVLGRDDVDFYDFQLEKDLYCACCIERKDRAE